MMRTFLDRSGVIRSGMATAAALGIGCVLAAGGVGALALMGPEGATPAEVQPSAPAVEAIAGTTAAVVDFEELARRCVRSFSKDLCEGSLQPGQMIFGGCEEEGCRTVHMHEAGWKFNLQHNQQLCASFDPITGRCDEAFEKDGTIEAVVSYTMRYQSPCRFRASLDGKWKLAAIDGTIYTGDLIGTMGVGSHRASMCEFGGRDCERCLDVTFDPNSGVWRIAVEAAFRGTRQISTTPVPDQIYFTLSGDFLAAGDQNGPFEGEEWRFAGTADGVHLDPCN